MLHQETGGAFHIEIKAHNFKSQINSEVTSAILAPSNVASGESHDTNKSTIPRMVIIGTSSAAKIFVIGELPATIPEK